MSNTNPKYVCDDSPSFKSPSFLQLYHLLWLTSKWLRKKPINPTVNSRKSRTLFINYDFRWLMVAEIFPKIAIKAQTLWPNYQLKRKLDGKSIANFLHNFPLQNHYCPPTWLVIPLLYILIKYLASLVCCLLVYYCCPTPSCHWQHPHMLKFGLQPCILPVTCAGMCMCGYVVVYSA